MILSGEQSAFARSFRFSLMGRALLLPLFLLITTYGYADTIGVYIAKLNKKTVAEVTEFDTLHLKFSADTVHISDTLYVDHWGCGGGVAYGKTRATVIDSASGDTVYTAITFNRGYLVPLNPLLQWNKAHPHSVFRIQFGSAKATGREKVRVVVRME